MVIHLPYGVRERLERLRKKLNMECLSDVIIQTLNEYEARLAEKDAPNDT